MLWLNISLVKYLSAQEWTANWWGILTTLAIWNFKYSEPCQFSNMKPHSIPQIGSTLTVIGKLKLDKNSNVQCFSNISLNFYKNQNSYFRNLCLVVVWNLVTIAVERYLAVCQPFKHSGFTKQKVIGIFILMYTVGIPCVFLAAFDVIIFWNNFN